MKKMIVKRLMLIAVACLTVMVLRPPCVISSVLGFPCPGCGMTRAAYSLLQLDFGAALHQNAIIFLAPVLIWAIVTEGRMVKSRLINRIILIVLLVLCIISYIIKLTIGGF